MQRHYTGVHGRIIDLCKPSQKKYYMAVTVAMGRHTDAVVVDSEATALECVQYLKEQRLASATFIPLDTIQVTLQLALACSVGWRWLALVGVGSRWLALARVGSALSGGVWRCTMANALHVARD